MKKEEIYKLLFEITTDIDTIDMKMKKVQFPVDENNFGDKNFLKLYACSKQYNVLKKVCSSIIEKLDEIKTEKNKDIISQFEIISSCIPTYDFDTLEICPEAEDLKLKYIKYLKTEKINLNNHNL